MVGELRGPFRQNEPNFVLAAVSIALRRRMSSRSAPDPAGSLRRYICLDQYHYRFSKPVNKALTYWKQNTGLGLGAFHDRRKSKNQMYEMLAGFSRAGAENPQRVPNELPALQSDDYFRYQLGR